MKCRFKLRLLWINELLYFISMLIKKFCLHFLKKEGLSNATKCLYMMRIILYQSFVYLVQVSTRYRKEQLGSINSGMLPKMRSASSCVRLYNFKGMQRIMKNVQVCTCTCNPFNFITSFLENKL